jgi:hypothetical protein
MNAKAAFFNDRKYFFDPHLTCVVYLKGASRPKSAMDDCKDEANRKSACTWHQMGNSQRRWCCSLQSAYPPLRAA